MKYIPRLKKRYNEEIVNILRKNYKSVMQVPRLEKICLNQGVGKGSSDKKMMESAQQEMSLITGQKAIMTRSKKDISNFKLRKGMPVGVMTTLRGSKMYEFLDRLITATLPRVRDFKGISDTGFDGRGNYTLGITEQIVFPEISIDKVSEITGMDITFVTNTDSDNEALLLLKELGLPFNNEKSVIKAEKLKEVQEAEQKRKKMEILEKASESIEETNEEETNEEETNEEETNEEETNEEETNEEETNEEETNEEETNEEETKN